MKPYQYRSKRHAAPEYTGGQAVLRAGEKEILTGVVQGMNASDIEERTARALDRLEIPFGFRVRLTSEALGQRKVTRRFANVRGEIEIDMLCEFGGRVVPIFVDGQIAHYFTPYQAEEDRRKVNETNEFGEGLGWAAAVRIPFWKLDTQDAADKTIRDIFL